MDNIDVQALLIGCAAGVLIGALIIWLGVRYVKRQLAPTQVATNSHVPTEPQTQATTPTPKPAAEPVQLVVPEESGYTDPRTYLTDPVRPSAAHRPAVRQPVQTVQAVQAVQATTMPQAPAAVVSEVIDLTAQRDQLIAENLRLQRETQLLLGELDQAQQRDTQVTQRWQDSERQLASSQAAVETARKEIADIRGFVLELGKTAETDPVIDLR